MIDLIEAKTRTKHTKWKLTNFVALHLKNAWVCPNDHPFEATVKTIESKNPTCQICKNEVMQNFSETQIEKKCLTKESKQRSMQRNIERATNALIEQDRILVSIGENHGSNTIITSKCSRGHIRSAKAVMIYTNRVKCKECLKAGLDNIKDIIYSNNATLVNSTGEGTNDILTIECKHGHQFEVANRDLRRRNEFCLKCKEANDHDKSEERRKNLAEKRNIKQKERKERADEHALRKGGEAIWVKGHKVLWKCSEGHEWIGSVGNEVTNDIWCRKCRYKKYYRENEVSIILDKLYPNKFKRNYRPKWLKNPKTGWPLELDFFSKKLMVAIEVNGRQHYEYSPPFHKTENDLEYAKKKDKFKIKKCEEMGIKLVIIPYTIEYKELEEVIKQSV